MKMAFNELSLNFPSDTIEQGKDLMENFLIVYRQLVNKGIDSKILIEKNFDGTLLYKGYPIEKWRNDYTVDKDLRRVYARLNDNAEFISREEYLSEFICEDGMASFGCLVAYDTNDLTISFCSNDKWKSTIINGTLYELENESLVEKDVQVNNISTKENIYQMENIITNRLHKEKFDITTGIDLWNNKDKLFINLIFCEDTKKQLFGIQSSYIKQIIKKLSLLDNYFNDWDSRKFNKDQIPNVDPESDETLKRFKAEHTFMGDNNRSFVCSYHIRFSGNYEGRIYFYPDSVTGKGFIGHIGGKLPTVNWVNPN